MFAAAAVAAAAALTAISTTSAHPLGNNNINSTSHHAGGIQLQQYIQHSQHQPQQRPPNYISWHQYAIERRNSLQRRKIEITKRLEKASNANNPNSTNGKSKVNLVSLERETGAFKSRVVTTTATPVLAIINSSGINKVSPKLTATASTNSSEKSERLKLILSQKGNFKLFSSN
jgi:hypothetical protein